MASTGLASYARLGHFACIGGRIEPVGRIVGASILDYKASSIDVQPCSPLTALPFPSRNTKFHTRFFNLWPTWATRRRTKLRHGRSLLLARPFTRQETWSLSLSKERMAARPHIKKPAERLLKHIRHWVPECNGSPSSSSIWAR